MKNKNQKMNESAEFMKGGAYIHTEVGKSRIAETILCGEIPYIIHGLVGAITRVSEKMGVTFNEILGIIVTCKKMGFDTVEELLGTRNINHFPEDKEESTENVDMLKKKIKHLEEELNRYKEDCEAKEWLISSLKKQKEKTVAHCDKRVREITKECKALEHRMKEMEEARFNNE